VGTLCQAGWYREASLRPSVDGAKRFYLQKDASNRAKRRRVKGKALGGIIRAAALIVFPMRAAQEKTKN